MVVCQAVSLLREVHAFSRTPAGKSVTPVIVDVVRSARRAYADGCTEGEARELAARVHALGETAAAVVRDWGRR